MENRTEPLFTLRTCTLLSSDETMSVLELKPGRRGTGSTEPGSTVYSAEKDGAKAEAAVCEKDQLQALFLSASLPDGSFAKTDGVQLQLAASGDASCEEASFLAIYQHKQWWIRPAFCGSLSEIPQRSQLVLTKRGNIYECFLTVSGKTCRADLMGSDGGLLLTLSSNCDGLTEQQDLALIHGTGEDPYALIEEAFSYALSLTGKPLPLRRGKPFPYIFEGLGWCTWDSLGQDVSEQAIFEKMDEFRALGVPVQWVLIDDGWSECDREKKTLRSLKADPERFPQGLEGTVRVLKEEYGVHYVGVWQTMQGYWYGIEPGSEAEEALRPYLQTYPDGILTVRPDAAASFGFWNTWHSELKKAGIDFIKVDNQSSFARILSGTGTFGESLSALHEGLEASALLNFEGQLINCMGMSSENLWNRKTSALSRNSDDYFPRIENSFTEHALENSYNSIYQGCLYWGDWDMVWSRIDHAEQGILLRAMSGGPFYVSDGLNATDPEMIGRVVFPDGKITRCQDVARPTLDCLLDPDVMQKKALKIYNVYDEVTYAVFFLAAEAPAAVRDAVRRSDFPKGLPERFWIYDWQTGQARLLQGEEEYPVEIQPGEAALYQILPADESAAVVGVAEKYISRAAVDWTCEEQDALLVRLGEPGTLRLLTEKTVTEVQIDGKAAAFHQEQAVLTVPVPEAPAILRLARRVCRREDRYGKGN